MLLLVLALTKRFLRLRGLRKEIMGTDGIACLHLSELCRMGKKVCRIDAILGRAGLYVTTKGILLVCVFVVFLCMAWVRGVFVALWNAD